ncbi:glycerophosphodiester phosphodiesterase [Cellvibrio mixtus]|uniref:glycerophosphodiester phosphodiesterase n=1 Tax=Cellvibrio mixtus TaxID=39650 RepID=UPI001F29D85A|nr:glycerophosphodiester phosphodiesterase [Cellvibrio mixtus]
MMSNLTKPLLCIAHRGGPQMGPAPLPENSLAAIARALSLGVYAVEIDVFQIEGELLVTHDRRLGRVVSGQGIITEQPLSYLREQRLENGEPVPTLQQVLELVGDKALLNIEIKGQNSVLALKKILQDYIDSHQGSYEQYTISSFDHQQLYQCLQHIPQVKRGVLIEGIPLDYAACCELLKAYSFNTHLSFITPELIQDAQKRGLKNWVYTVNHEDDWRYMQSLGVDAVFTDKPDKLLEFNQH